MRGTSRLGTDFGEADLQDAVLECGIGSAANFTDATLLRAKDFVPRKTDLLCRTILPDGSICTDI